jgi:hypothetical protein
MMKMILLLLLLLLLFIIIYHHHYDYCHSFTNLTSSKLGFAPCDISNLMQAMIASEFVNTPQAKEFSMSEYKAYVLGGHFCNKITQSLSACCNKITHSLSACCNKITLSIYACCNKITHAQCYCPTQSTQTLAGDRLSVVYSPYRNICKSKSDEKWFNKMDIKILFICFYPTNVAISLKSWINNTWSLIRWFDNNTFESWLKTVEWDHILDLFSTKFTLQSKGWN